MSQKILMSKSRDATASAPPCTSLRALMGMHIYILPTCGGATVEQISGFGQHEKMRQICVDGLRDSRVTLSNLKSPTGKSHGPNTLACAAM
jgi:hypothetical protein